VVDDVTRGRLDLAEYLGCPGSGFSRSEVRMLAPENSSQHVGTASLHLLIEHVFDRDGIPRSVCQIHFFIGNQWPRQAGNWKAEIDVHVPEGISAAHSALRAKSCLCLAETSD
jgi:hypothetical protein